jgi:ribonuclease BN (tRNA processing enzyme)
MSADSDRRRLRHGLLSASLAILAGAAAAQPAPPPAVTFTTLGTMAGPIASPTRSQPANLLSWGNQAILIDAGDGTAEQLAKAHVPLGTIHTIFISHLHFDHTGGLFALLGMRYQVLTPGDLTIYGPPGTQRLVDGLLAAMQPAAEVGAGVPGAVRRPPEAGVHVIEIADGAHVTIADATVTVARNSHYSWPEGSPEAARYQSLSFRFDLPGRSIAYTGDTGPSTNVERLAHNVDLLVSEVIEPDAVLQEFLRARPDLPAFVVPIIRQHFNEQHLNPEAAGRLARAAGARRLVLTHVAIAGRDPEQVRAAVAAAYGGPVVIAGDLDHF